jgi:intein/homing endonuclease
VDFTQSLVRAILDGGKPAYREFLSRAIPPEILQGVAAPALEYIAIHYSQYGALPDVGVIEAKLGIPLPPAMDGCTAGFWADEILKNAIGNEVKRSVDTALDLLKSQQNIESFEELQQAVYRIQRLQVGAADSRVTSMFDEGPNVWDYYLRMEAGERGIMTPWATMNDTTLGFNKEELILFVARSGIGKCVCASTRIVDPETGEEHTIEEVVSTPSLKLVTTWSPEKGIHSTPITAKVDTGHKRCLKFTYASGRSVTVTPEHPLLTAEGWKPAEQFKVGMTVALPARMPAPEHPEDLPSETVFLLALLLAEGSYTSRTVGFSTADPEILERAHEAARAFGVEVRHRANYDYAFAWDEGLGRPVKALLRQYGMDGILAKHKTIPAVVYRLPTKSLSEFISTFWMCDGYVDSTGPGVTLASEKMVRQLQSLLLRLGIQSSVGYKQATCDGKKFDAWRLRVYSSSLENFAREVHLWGEKAQRVTALLKKKRNTNVGYPRVSREFEAKIAALAKARSGRWTGDGSLVRVAKLLGRDPAHKAGQNSYFGVRDMFGANGSLWLRPFKAFCEVFGIESEYRWLWSSDIFWDVIESIEDVGQQKIYDLTVEPTSCFVANDIIVHNTFASLMLAEHASTGYKLWTKVRDDQGNYGPLTEVFRKHKVLYVTTEMSKMRIALRFFALKEKLPFGRVRSGQLTVFERERLEKATKNVLNEKGLTVVGGNFDFRVETLAAAIDEAQPEMVIIDGIYLIKVPGKDRIEQAANAFSEVKRLTMSKKLPIVVTSQFNREVKKNQAATATAESIALTDAAVWHSTLIFGLVQTDDNKKEKRMQVKQLKVRDGDGRDFELNWDFESSNFSEVLAQGSGDVIEPIDIGGGSGDPGSVPF